MFCTKCGKQLSDNAKFCSNCGTKTNNSANSTLSVPDNRGGASKLVPAKCTNCGGQLTVDEKQKSAICPFCNSSFIVEQAINNYNVQVSGNLNVGNATININGLNMANLIARAGAFESQNDLETALDYYNRVLDIDINNADAIHGIQRINQKQKNMYIQSLLKKGKSYEIVNQFDVALECFYDILEIDKENIEAIRGISRVEQKKKDYVYIVAQRKTLLGSTEIIEVRRDKISIFKKNGDIVKEYFIKEIKSERFEGGQLVFNYPGNDWFPVKISCGDNTYDIFEFIIDAKSGIYPEYEY